MGADESSLRDENILKIVVIGPKSGEEAFSQLCYLPQNAFILATGNNYDELTDNGCDISEGNVILNLTGNCNTVPLIVFNMPHLRWFHTCSAGLDNIWCSELINSAFVITNAKGVFSHSLAEYVMAMCLTYAKDVPRLMQNKNDRAWDRFQVGDLRDKVMGIIGYGDIGQACARLARGFGMRVVGVRRRPELSDGDESVDKVYNMHGINTLMGESDYIVACLPLLPDTKKIINKSAFQHAKHTAVFINIGRGGTIDEHALVYALQTRMIAGAALDVYTTEPLPKSSPLWDAPNLIMSPHNADNTAGMKDRSVRKFTENCSRYVQGQPVHGVVNKVLGY